MCQVEFLMILNVINIHDLKGQSIIQANRLKYEIQRDLDHKSH